MSAAVDLPYRVVAERERDSPVWSFYLVNDGDATLQSGELAAVKYEWGDQYVGGESPDLRFADIAPGARTLIWQDDGSSEMRTDLWLRLTHEGLDTWLYFEFPRLYRQTGTTLVAHPTRAQRPPGGVA
jgi:hypothetical protein